MIVLLVVGCYFGLAALVALVLLIGRGPSARRVSREVQAARSYRP